MKTEEEIAEFITKNPLAWRIWMTGYEAGLAQGRIDERVSTDDLADLTARRIMTLQDCEEHIRKTTKNTIAMGQAIEARANTTVGTYRGGPIAWE
ncbi:hypothetical protein SAMN04489740_4154 [Arthrobacter alpinus]|uniref:Uncharacterized protein n=1 Tax=Arthrobacter alpinus TaxID=656366 RepID=A0A1H5PDL3_9MICC|nr:hypothetical protein [Arthrobacter alpinus]SEF11876.1 hypothetical protein SAMN04489740_4154 [Arthrobacter alpinus]